MTLSETYMMLTFFVALLALLVQVAGTAFDIAWKISHDERHKNDNKKASNRHTFPNVRLFAFCK